MRAKESLAAVKADRDRLLVACKAAAVKADRDRLLVACKALVYHLQTTLASVHLSWAEHHGGMMALKLGESAISDSKGGKPSLGIGAEQ